MIEFLPASDTFVLLQVESAFSLLIISVAVALISAQSFVMSMIVVYCDVTVKRITYFPVKRKMMFQLRNAYICIAKTKI